MRPPLSPEQQKRNQRMIAVAATLIIGTLVVSKVFGECSPQAREAHQFLRTMPVEQIISISIEPYQVLSLVTKKVVVSDRGDLERLAAHLRSAQPVGLNHPNAQWVAVLRIRTLGEDYGGQVESTTNQGVIVSWASGVQGGWYYGTVRQDALGPLLEELVTRAGARK